MRNVLIPIAFIILILVTVAPAEAALDPITDLRRFIREADVEEIADYLRGFQPWTALISIGLFVLESVIAPLPALFLIAANGLVFGVWWGFAVSMVGILLGSLTSFFIARWVGRRFIRRHVPTRYLQQADELSSQRGFIILFLARFIPVTSSDLWSYAAGMSKMSPAVFVAATGLAEVPSALLLSYLGQELPRAEQYLRQASFILLGLVVAGILGYTFRHRLEDLWHQLSRRRQRS